MPGGRGRAAPPKLKATGDLLDSLLVPDSATIFNGSNSMSDFEFGRSSTSPAFFQAGEIGSAEEDLELEGCSRVPEKKRRLSSHQVRFLERIFEVENRLEPKRKAELAKELGLQPRQVAIWFQNRRARLKSKQIEKDYDSLRACYDSLKAKYDSLLKEKEKLKHEVDSLKHKLLDQEDSADEKYTKPLKSARPLNGEPQELAAKGDATSTKSDVSDPGSPRLTEPGNSSQGLEPETSEVEDGNSLMIAPFGYPPKIEDGYNCSPADYTSCGFGFSSEDHPFWNWTY